MMVSESKIFSFQFCVDWWENKYFYENERIVQKLNSDDHQTSVVDRLAFIRMITMTMAKDNRLNQKTEVLLYEKGNMQCSIQTLWEVTPFSKKSKSSIIKDWQFSVGGTLYRVPRTVAYAQYLSAQFKHNKLNLQLTSGLVKILPPLL